jgi:thiamine-phosphate pyrophosphorylase
MFVTDRSATLERPLAEVVMAAIRGGASLIQVREKDLDGKALFELVTATVADTKAIGRARTRVVVNDRLDVALAAKAAGVHLPAAGLPVKDVRRVAGPRFLVGRSVHSLAEARAAWKAGADYVVAGPVFPTPSKAAFGEPLGPGALQAIAAAVHIPVWAIGGITPENAAELKGLHLAGVAAIRSIASAPDPEEAVRALAAAIGVTPHL